MTDAFTRVVGASPEKPVEIRASDRPEFGDYSTNMALIEAKTAGRPPRRLADDLASALESCELLAHVEIAGPGFINLFLHPAPLLESLRQVLVEDDRYGVVPTSGAPPVQVEFVSSNPTGPLTVGHGRQAVLGDVLANLYARRGHTVHREYYFNDEGRQIDLLAESLWVRFREHFGESREIPEGGYQGEYLKEIATELVSLWDSPYPDFDDATRETFRTAAVERTSAMIKSDLEELGVRFDHWFSETTLHRAGKVDAALAALRGADGIYEKDGAVWLRAEERGGAKDSVLIRSDGRPTYLMVDIAYHIDKHERGFSWVLDVQGADHHAEQSCMLAAMDILGYPKGFLRYVIHQFVSLKEGGEVQRMSTRAGRFITLHDLIEDLGRDVVRYFMISRKPEAHLDFDLDLARAESLDNPATYVKYAHTRIASIFRKADVGGTKPWSEVDLAPLRESEEFDLIKNLDRFPEVIEAAAEGFAPHLIAEYAQHLARAFHAYYDKHRVLGDDESLSRARLALLRAIKTVLRHCLDILGMDAPEAM